MFLKNLTLARRDIFRQKLGANFNVHLQAGGRSDELQKFLGENTS